ncbi:MAG TPA: S46 family peptidase [Terriglobales bacterium]|nr:S46 family peptidase [Terriglobales bacterium]
MIKRLGLYLVTAVLFATAAWGDEGMWLYNAFPSAKVKEKYGFEPSKPWLDHVRLASVRFNSGGSGSFVSPNGLAFTNHHIAQDCLKQLGTAEHDYMKTGFYAKSRKEEAKCPDVELNVLESIADVTQQIQSAATSGMNTAETGQAERARMSQIENDCAKTTGLRCDVVTLYSGGMYHLYRYKKYTDVRLVFAPEFEAAFFGGDPDNFEYPRYDLDIAFFRVYENNRPVHIKDWLRWSRAGVKEGDLIFVSGNPGGTDRLRTMSELQFMKDVQYPFLLKTYELWNTALKDFAAKSPENARQAREDIFDFENVIKAYKGEYTGLTNQELMARKAAVEQKLRQYVASDPKWKDAGDPWAAIAGATKVHGEIFNRLIYLERRFGFRGTLNSYARTLLRAAEERAKPNDQRLREYRESALPSIQQTVLSTAPIYKGLETVWFETSLADAAQKLGDDPAIQAVLKGRSPVEVAREAIANTRLDDVNYRKELWSNPGAVKASQDPLIVIMRTIDPAARELRKKYDDQVEAVDRVEGAKIAQARFAQAGTEAYPDATFTLRLSYGAVKGYVEGNEGPTPPGTKLPYFTTISGAYGHAVSHDNKPPYNLPDSWLKAKPKVQGSTALNVVETADIIGGNSGSPVVNTAGEIVGIIFDGNIYSNAWNFAYEDEYGRSIQVDSRGIMEALRKIYGANALADELMGTPDTRKTARKAATPGK